MANQLKGQRKMKSLSGTKILAFASLTLSLFAQTEVAGVSSVDPASSQPNVTKDGNRRPSITVVPLKQFSFNKDLEGDVGLATIAFDQDQVYVSTPDGILLGSTSLASDFSPILDTDGQGISKIYVYNHTLYVLASPAAAESEEHAMLQSKDKGQSFTAIDDGLQTTCASQLGDDAQTAVNQLQNFLTGLRNLCGTPKQVGQAVRSDLITLMGGVIVDLLKAVNTVVDTVLDLVPLLLDAIMWMFKRPINNGGLASLWKSISGSPLSLLDVITLLTAIPVTIIMKVAGIPLSTGVGGSNFNFYNISSAVATVIGSLVDCACDALNAWPSSNAAYIDWLFPFIAFSINGFILADSSATDYQISYLLLGLLSWMPPAAAAYIAFMPQPITQITSAVKDSLPEFNMLYGLVMCGIAVVFCFKDTANFQGKDYLSLVSNVVGNLGYIFKPFSDDPETLLITLVADIVGPTGGVIANMVELGIT
jgi:hypothetical protein